jgi:hypothetical protein
MGVFLGQEPKVSELLESGNRVIFGQTHTRPLETFTDQTLYNFVASL